MAQFYGEIRGNRGPASRMGSKASGFFAHIRGWHVGVEIRCEYDEKRNCDVIRIYRTGGSVGRTRGQLIATLYEKDETLFEKILAEDCGIILHKS